jgi:hypothetical protein
MPQSHQTFRLVPVVELLGIMFRNRCWHTGFHIIAARDANGWCLKLAGVIGPSAAGKFLGIVDQDPSDSKSNRLHVDIFRFCFHSFEIYSIDSSKMIDNSPKVPNFNRFFFSNSTGSSVTNRRFSPTLLRLIWLASTR